VALNHTKKILGNIVASFQCARTIAVAARLRDDLDVEFDVWVIQE